jgi:hypothetical protein
MNSFVNEGLWKFTAGAGWSERLPAQKRGGLYKTCHHRAGTLL